MSQSAATTPSESSTNAPPPGTNAPFKRRGLLAALWAAAIGLTLKATTRSAAAANGDPVLAGVTGNNASADTWLQSTSAGRGFFSYATSPSNLIALEGWSDGQNGIGVRATSLNNTGTSYGLFAQNGSPLGTGVYADALSSSGATHGVRAVSRSPNGIGVLGRSGTTGLQSGVGVQGESGGGIGVFGRVPETSSSNATAVYGLNYSTYAGPGPGAGGFGVYGLSAKGHGLVGATASAGAAALVGATNGVAGAFAGAFYGPVLVGGDFTVFGAKSAAVPHPDGSHRRLYCVESPDSWFEDFGDAQLVDGAADITIDPDFAAVVDAARYQVFLTEYDDHHALYVTDRTPRGFRVRARDGSGCGSFSWRLVARRRDIAGERFATVVLPPEPQLPAPPQPAPASTTLDPGPRITPTRVS